MVSLSLTGQRILLLFDTITARPRFSAFSKSKNHLLVTKWSNKLYMPKGILRISARKSPAKGKFAKQSVRCQAWEKGIHNGEDETGSLCSRSHLQPFADDTNLRTPSSFEWEALRVGCRMTLRSNRDRYDSDASSTAYFSNLLPS